ncbi:hypothetical protein Bca52824_000252 [Brassica carinata]|uniref:Uncharacterized protein n=1 Tax=Brassica carinata TaxID=52824 RepID=A0A8X7WGU9_BRACI|nr:hypothetical protein Bca52824_000252 [Brassica carinata]
MCEFSILSRYVFGQGEMQQLRDKLAIAAKSEAQMKVSEEYTLVPDALYLTVYLIDWFSPWKQHRKKTRIFQLLGI